MIKFVPVYLAALLITPFIADASEITPIVLVGKVQSADFKYYDNGVETKGKYFGDFRIVVEEVLKLPKDYERYVLSNGTETFVIVKYLTAREELWWMKQKGRKYLFHVNPYLPGYINSYKTDLLKIEAVPSQGSKDNVTMVRLETVVPYLRNYRGDFSYANVLTQKVINEDFMAVVIGWWAEKKWSMPEVFGVFILKLPDKVHFLTLDIFDERRRGDYEVKIIKAGEESLILSGSSIDYGYGIHRTTYTYDLGKRKAAGKAKMPEPAALSERLISKNESTRHTALQELGKLDEAAVKKLVPVLIKTLRGGKSSGREDVRSFAAIALGKMGPLAKDAAPALIEVLRVKYSLLPKLAIEALGKMAPAAEEAVPALIQELKDRGNRYNAAEALGEIGPAAKAAVPALIEALQDDSIRSEAAEALGNIGPAAKDAIPSLIWVLQRTTSYTEAANALVKIGSAAVPAIITLLEERYQYPNYPNARMETLKVLGRIGPAAKEAIPVLTRFLKGDNVFVRSIVVWALSAMGAEAIPALVQALDEEDFNRRNSVSRSLGEMGPAAVPALISVLQDGKSCARKGAVRALGDIGPAARDAVPALIRALGDEDFFLRLLAASSLADIGPAARDAVPALKQALKDKSPGVRDNARRALRAIGPKPGESSSPEDDSLHVRRAAATLAKIDRSNTKEDIPALIKALEDDNWYVRSSAVRRLHKLGPVAVPVLIQALKDGNRHVRSSAVQMLSGMRPAAKEAVPALARALSDSHFQVRDGAASALLEMGPAAKDAVPALILALNDEVWTIRNTAAEALGKIGPPAKTAVPALMRALRYKRTNGRKMGIASSSLHVMGQEPPIASSSSDRNPSWESADVAIRRTAAEALGNIGPAAKLAIPVLMKALKDIHLTVRIQSAMALGKMGPLAKDAVPALTEALQDSDTAVRDNAKKALMEIRATKSKQQFKGAELLIQRISDGLMQCNTANSENRFPPGYDVMNSIIESAKTMAAMGDLKGMQMINEYFQSSAGGNNLNASLFSDMAQNLAYYDAITPAILAGIEKFYGASITQGCLYLDMTYASDSKKSRYNPDYLPALLVALENASHPEKVAHQPEQAKWADRSCRAAAESQLKNPAVRAEFLKRVYPSLSSVHKAIADDILKK